MFIKCLDPDLGDRNAVVNWRVVSTCKKIVEVGR